MRQHLVLVNVRDGRLQLVLQLPPLGYLPLDQLLALGQLVGLRQHELLHAVGVRLLVLQTLGHHLPRVHAVGPAEERLVPPALHHHKQQLAQLPLAVGHGQVRLVGDDRAGRLDVAGPRGERRQHDLRCVPGERFVRGW